MANTNTTTSASARPKITLYVDVVSPFAYLGYYMLRHHPIFSSSSPSKVEITYTPIFLGGLMQQCKNITPINITNKATYIDKERRRWMKQFNIPMRLNFPQGFPMETPTLQIQRFLTALKMSHPQHFVTALDALYAAFWAPGDAETADAKVWQVPVFAELLRKATGIPAHVVDECLTKMAGKDVKAELSANTQQAFENGAFGLPWFQCETVNGEREGFWGFDHVGQVVRFLDLKGNGSGSGSGSEDGIQGELRSLL